MTTRVIETLSAELTDLLFELGPRTLILLEGPDDVDVFEEFYGDKLGEVLFYPASGYSNVQEGLDKLLGFSRTDRVYGIIDRDFRDDSAVDAALFDLDAHLFILRRYTIENYLLEPAALHEELRIFYGRKHDAPEVTEIQVKLLELCGQLVGITAAHWLFWEAQRGIEYFPVGHDVIGNRGSLVREVALRLSFSEQEAENLLLQKEQMIRERIGTLERAHVFINGKHLLHLVYCEYINKVKKGLRKDHLRNLLARAVKALGISDDIREIVERRILKINYDDNS